MAPVDSLVTRPPTSTTPPPTNLLTLPYELRHGIFCYYFTAEGGYVFNAESEQLTTADGSLIELSLMYTCRSIADETKHLPLTLNSVTFSTMLRDDLSSWAARFEYLSIFQCLLQSDLLVHLRDYITPEIYSQIALKFPHFAPHLEKTVRRYHEVYGGYAAIGDVFPRSAAAFWDDLTKGRMLSRGLMRSSFHHIRVSNWPYALLMFKEAIAYSLQLVKRQEEERFSELINHIFPHWTGSQSPYDLEDIWLKPWAMPDSSVLRKIGQLFGDSAAWQRLEDWYSGCTTSDTDSEAEEQEASWLFREKFRFSAASVAIWFLEGLPNETRRQLRNVVLREDHVSMHSPECHAHGLIPFCKENPRLHIERRISLFQNAFHHVPALTRLTRLVEKTHDEDVPLKTQWITRNLCGWLLEALAAVDAGMPANSFTLVLDGEPDINTCSDIFQQVIHRDIACERAYQKRQAQDGSPTHDRDPVSEFVQEGFPEAIDLLLHQTSILRCNFHPGESWDPDKLADELSSIPLECWKEHDSCAKPRFVYLAPCLPEWRELLLESFDKSRIS
ncbi:hypothetical protein CDV31_016192 [Fusarium ambrosium]|uniref:Uncharacterized protein n=1 Tax=Fusarium ambrosium TaxID=131363 RepID=A0A428SDB3_9HYPO|nr:hypothetical protein CDV31_016192 [Fusarium ambrosium]